MALTTFHGEDYLPFVSIESWLRHAVEILPRWAKLREIGRSRQGRAIWMLEIHDFEDGEDNGPAVWIDGGTHATEFTGVMAALTSASRWLEGLEAGDAELTHWFGRGRAFIVPCISPDGYVAMFEGAPFIRSTLRPPKPGTPRVGFEPMDVDGDGKVLWMRWKHPAGPFVPDEEEPMFMRRRTLDDNPDGAYFYCSEGEFLEYDGTTWVSAPLRHGLDLNRTFPSNWEPFSMFGMDSGEYPGSEPESRALLDTFAEYPYIGAALTNHTYTGCILTQPYRDPSPLGDADCMRMEILAKHMVADTSYKVFRVMPDFTYDKKKPIVGVWADTISTVFGVPGYTMEYWDPYGYAGIELDKPAEFFLRPDPDKIKQVITHFANAHAELIEPWREFEHPQLGTVELGGIDYLRSVRNPPPELLAPECHVGYLASERMRKSVPNVRISAGAELIGEDTWQVEMVVENLGFLPIAGLDIAAQRGLGPARSVTLHTDGGNRLADGTAVRELPNLAGWGCAQAGAAKHSLYPSLGATSHRHIEKWLIWGSGSVKLEWRAGRAGHGVVELQLGE